MKDSRLEQLKDKIPQNVKGILSTLEKNGFEAYVVGGCVRDAILGKEPHDWDITTNATPEEIHKCFKNKHIIDTGLQHGTVTVMAGHGENRDGYEITTYRIDGNYSDGRHPDSVQFTKDIKEDLSRRDFTINAMAYNPKTGLVDPFHGYEALTKHMYPEINCVGYAEDRFTEDSLRILRGIRFIAKLNASVSQQTCDAMNNVYIVDKLKTVSQERKTSELLKMLETDRPYIINEFLFDKLEAKSDTHSHFYIAEYIIPYDKHIYLRLPKENPVSVSYMKLLPTEERDAFTKDPAIRLALFLLDTTIQKEDLAYVLKEMKLSNTMIKDTINAYSFFNTYPLRASSREDDYIVELKALAGNIGIDTVKTYLNIEHLFTKTYRPVQDIKVLDYIKQFEEAVINKEPMSMKDLNISGTTVKSMVSQPSDTGVVLNTLLEEVLHNPSLNNEEYLINRAKEIAKTFESEREDFDRE